MTSTFFLFHIFLFPPTAVHLEVVEPATDFFPIHFSVVYFKMWLSEVFDMW